MLMYDTRAKPEVAKFESITRNVILLSCPHISFENPMATENVPPQESGERRCVVITAFSRSSCGNHDLSLYSYLVNQQV